MNTAKQGRSKEGKVMHYSVGAVIERKEKYLLINRANIPYGWAGIAGHIDEGEDPLTALKRELKEESGLTLEKATLLYEEECKNTCSKGRNIHYWYLYVCQVSGKVLRNERETKAIGWYTKEEVKKIKLEPIWKYWLKKMKVI